MNCASTARTARRLTEGLPWDLRSEKIQSWHRERLAVVYVRQSSPQQVLDHQESTRLQYGLTIRARKWDGRRIEWW